MKATRHTCLLLFLSFDLMINSCGRVGRLPIGSSGGTSSVSELNQHGKVFTTFAGAGIATHVSLNLQLLMDFPKKVGDGVGGLIERVQSPLLTERRILDSQLLCPDQHPGTTEVTAAIDVVYSACGIQRKDELLRSIYSLVLLHTATATFKKSVKFYRIHIITDGVVHLADLLPPREPAQFCYLLHKPNSNAAQLFAPCSTQRLYLHGHTDFQDIDQAIYLDVDTLWLDTPDKVLKEFEEMEKKQAYFAMTDETSEKNGDGSWYKGGHHYSSLTFFLARNAIHSVAGSCIAPMIDNHIRAVRSSRPALVPSEGVFAPFATRKGLIVSAGFSRDLPYYGDYGLNAGVLLLNLRYLRESNFNIERDKIITHFFPKHALPLGDQDVLNAYAHKFPKRVHVMSCVYNFRSDSACYDGFPAIVHGNRNLRLDENSTYSTLYHLYGTIKLLNYT